MKHRGKKVAFLSFSARRRKKKQSIKRYSQNWSTSTSNGTIEESGMEIDVSQILSDDESGSHIQELGERSLHYNGMIPFIDASHWLGVTGDLSLAKLPSTLFDACKWCGTKVQQSLEFAKDVVFPSRVYWRELHSTQDQLRSLTEQLQKIQEDIQTKESGERSDNSTAADGCSCRSCPRHNSSNNSSVSSNSPTTSTSQSATTSNPATNPVLQSGAHQQPNAQLPSSSSHQVAAPPPPVPPPITAPPSFPAAAPPPPPPPSLPPPPPPPPPPSIVAPPSNDWRKNLRKKKDGAPGNKEKEAAGSRLTISLNDIKGVKLKKVNRTEHQTSQPKRPVRGALVSLSDLQNVQLKRSNFRRLSDPKEPEMTLRTRLSLEAMEFRTTLKKIGFPRSPGGTPLRRKPAESGVGLTPIMTRALRRKFKNVNASPSGCSPKSPFSSPETPTGIRF